LAKILTHKEIIDLCGSIDLEFKADNTKKIEISTESGIIHLVKGLPGTIIQTSLVNENDLENCELTRETIGDTLVLKAKSKSNSVNFKQDNDNFNFFGDNVIISDNNNSIRVSISGKTVIRGNVNITSNSSCKVGFIVVIPSNNLEVQATSGSGNIVLTETSQDTCIKTGSGEVKLEKAVGKSISIKTGSGPVTGITSVNEIDIETGSGYIDLKRSGNATNIKTGSGGIRLSWEDIPKGRTEIKTGSGDIRLRFPKESRLKTNYKSGSGKMINGIGDSNSPMMSLDVRSSSGDLNIEEI